MESLGAWSQMLELLNEIYNSYVTEICNSYVTDIANIRSFRLIMNIP